jgi:hypothetical protein
MDQLPLWFLVLSLFLPRVSLIFSYFLNDLTSYSLNGWIPPTLAVFMPRILVIILIFQDRGFSGWIIVHAIALICVYGGAGSQSK